jgi:hypothetical protein
VRGDGRWHHALRWKGLTRFDRRGGGGGNNHALHDQCPRPYPEDQGPNPARKVPPNLPGHNGGPLTKAAYFTDMDGAQGAYFVVNVDEPPEMAAKTESLLQRLGRRYRSSSYGHQRMYKRRCQHSSKRHRSTAKREKAPRADTFFQRQPQDC